MASPDVGEPKAAQPTRRGVIGRLVWSAEAAFSKYRTDRCPQLAAAISYHVLFALVPLFAFVGTIFGLVLQDDERRQEVIDYLVDRFPLSEEAGVDLERVLADIPTPVSVIGLVSILAVLWAASGMMAAMRVGLTAALADGSTRPFAQSKLVDFLLVLGVALLLLVSFGLSIVVNAVERWSDTLAQELGAAGFGQWSILGIILPPLIAFVVFLLVYRLVPPVRPRFRNLWVGAAVAAIGFELVKIGFSLYLTHVARYDVLYGSLGSLFAFLFAVYLQASVFLFGAEVASAWSRSAIVEDVATGPQVSLPRRLLGAVRGLFVRS